MNRDNDPFDRGRLKALFGEFIDEVGEALEEARREAGPQAQRLKEESLTALGELLEELEDSARMGRERIQEKIRQHKGASHDQSGGADPHAHGPKHPQPEEEQPSSSLEEIPQSVLSPIYGQDIRSIINKDFGYHLREQALMRVGGVREQIQRPEDVPGLEDYLHHMGAVFNPTTTFLLLDTHAEQLSEKEFKMLEDFLFDVWKTRGGYALPGYLRELFRKVEQADSGADAYFEELEELYQQIYEAKSLREAQRIWKNARVDIPLQGAYGHYTDRQTAVAEFAVDLALLQRGIREDIQRARREAGRQGSLCAVLSEMDREAELEFEEMLGCILRIEDLPYDQLSHHHRRKLIGHAYQRARLHRAGLLNVDE